jgi:hypothetical protein
VGVYDAARREVVRPEPALSPPPRPAPELTPLEQWRRQQAGMVVRGVPGGGLDAGEGRAGSTASAGRTAAADAGYGPASSSGSWPGSSSAPASFNRRRSRLSVAAVPGFDAAAPPAARPHSLLGAPAEPRRRSEGSVRVGAPAAVQQRVAAHAAAGLWGGAGSEAGSAAGASGRGSCGASCRGGAPAPEGRRAAPFHGPAARQDDAISALMASSAASSAPGGRSESDDSGAEGRSYRRQSTSQLRVLRQRELGATAFADEPAPWLKLCLEEAKRLPRPFEPLPTIESLHSTLK